MANRVSWEVLFYFPLGNYILSDLEIDHWFGSEAHWFLGENAHPRQQDWRVYVCVCIWKSIRASGWWVLGFGEDLPGTPISPWFLPLLPVQDICPGVLLSVFSLCFIPGRCRACCLCSCRQVLTALTWHALWPQVPRGWTARPSWIPFLTLLWNEKGIRSLVAGGEALTGWCLCECGTWVVMYIGIRIKPLPNAKPSPPRWGLFQRWLGTPKIPATQGPVLP